MAGFREETKTFAGREITVRTLPFGKGREMLLKVMNIAAPALRDAKSGGSAGIMAMLLGEFDNDTVNYVAETLGAVSSAKIDGGAVLKMDKEGVRDSVFDVDYLAFFEWIKFGLEVQYRDFFVGLITRLASAEAEGKASL